MLVVDDEPLLAYDLTDLLQLYGARAAGTCMSIDEALDVLESDQKVDFAVLDIQVGAQEIWPCARRLEERQIPFLFVSAVCETRPLPAEFADRRCLPKPVDTLKLRTAIREMLVSA